MGQRDSNDIKQRVATSVREGDEEESSGPGVVRCQYHGSSAQQQEVQESSGIHSEGTRKSENRATISLAEGKINGPNISHVDK